MQFEQVLELSIEEGAVRLYRISDNLAYVYRYSQGRYEARGLYAFEGEWELGKRLVSTKDYSDTSGWHPVPYLPKQAKPIENEAALANPGYGFGLFRECYTCKEKKGPEHFSRANHASNDDREYECDKCYQRRQSELKQYQQQGPQRSGDSLSKETLSSPPPPSSQV